MSFIIEYYHFSKFRRSGASNGQSTLPIGREDVTRQTGNHKDVIAVDSSDLGRLPIFTLFSVYVLLILLPGFSSDYAYDVIFDWGNFVLGEFMVSYAKKTMLVTLHYKVVERKSICYEGTLKWKALHVSGD